MSMETINTRAMHEVYESLSMIQRQAIDKAYVAATNELSRLGFNIVGDDRAEQLTAAITYYFLRSGN